MKNKKLRAGFLIVLLLATTVLSIGWYTSQPRSTVLANNASNILPSLNQQEPSNNQPVSEDIRAIPQSQTIKGVKIELTSAKMIETGIQIGICYPTPDGGDWYPTPGSISYSTYEIHPDEFEFVSEIKADGVKAGKRCALIRYRIDEMDSITLPIQFTLLSYWAVPKELPPCENLQQRLDTNSSAKAYGLRVNCSYDEQTGLSVTLSEKLPSVAQAKAQQVLDEIVLGEVFGPWEFTITELEK